MRKLSTTVPYGSFSGEKCPASTTSPPRAMAAEFERSRNVGNPSA